jgi:DNA-binding beta-propeller fold protein YncE
LQAQSNISLHGVFLVKFASKSLIVASLRLTTLGSALLGCVEPCSAGHSLIKQALSGLPKNEVVATINLGADIEPVGIAVNPLQPYVYIGSGTGVVTIVDTTTNSVTSTITEPSGLPVTELAVSPDGTMLYVQSAWVRIYDTTTLALINTLWIDNSDPNTNSGMTLSPDGTRLYFVTVPAAIQNPEVLAYSASTGELLWDTTLSGNPIWGALGVPAVVVSPDGSYLYVPNLGSYYPDKPQTGFFSVVEASSGTLVGQMNFGKGEQPGSAYAISPDGSALYSALLLTEDGSPEPILQVFNVTTRKRTDEFMGNSDIVMGIAITPSGQYLYVAINEVSSGNGIVSMIDLARNKVVGNPISVGGVPNSIAIDPSGKYCYVVSHDGTLTVIDISPA